MKRLLLSSFGILTLAALANPALAADLSRRYQPTKAPPYIAQVYNWTGFYIGVNGGGGWGQSDWSRTGNFDLSGGLVGGTVGYNWQTGLGCLASKATSIGPTSTAARSTAARRAARPATTGSAPRAGALGYAFDRFMPYITGGLAVGNVQARPRGRRRQRRHQCRLDRGRRRRSRRQRPWSAKAEYLYVDLGNFNCGIACGVDSQRGIVHEPYRPRRHQLPVLIRAPIETDKAPGQGPGLFFCATQNRCAISPPAAWSPRRPALARRICRARRRAADSPCASVLETQITVAERASERDLADVGGVSRPGGVGFERGKPARDLAGLQIEPFLLVLFRRTVAAP